MGFLDIVGGIGRFITRPFEVITETISDWAHEPLKRWEYQRSEESKDNDVRRQIEIETARIKTESKLRMDEAEQNTNLEIKRATEIVRITKEIEEWQKDKQFERMKMVTEAIMVYQEKLTQLNINAIAAIGNMELSLREKAHNLILDKTQKYKEMQDKAIEQAAEKFVMIEDKFSANEKASTILYTAVDSSLSNIIKNASNFMDELNNDIKMLNSNIDILAKNGQRFIENHLQQFNDLAPNEVYQQIEKGNIKSIESNEYK
jgi:UDP-N-acetylglucosamine transferase subunit ALG13